MDTPREISTADEAEALDWQAGLTDLNARLLRSMQEAEQNDRGGLRHLQERAAFREAMVRDIARMNNVVLTGAAEERVRSHVVERFARPNAV